MTKNDANLVNHASQFTWKGVPTIQLHTPQCALMHEVDFTLESSCSCDGPKEQFENTVLTGGIESIIRKLIDTENTNTSDGFVKYLEIGMSDTAANASQTGTILPKSRKQVAYAAIDGTSAVFKAFFNGSEAVSNESNVAIGTSTTQFSVTSGTGTRFAVGQLIQVGMSTPQYVRITVLSTDTLTVTPALTGIPSGGETVKQAYKEIVLYGGDSASDTIGTGIAFARSASFSSRVKDSGYGLTVEWHISLS